MRMDEIKFSLIIGTLNRSQEIQSCVQSILHQTYTNYEVIIIDQSNNKETEKIFSEQKYARIQYHHVSFTGLSKARNKALKYASGNYICLIDDDAYYAPNYLELAAERIGKNSDMVYSGYIWDTMTNSPFVKYHHRKNGRTLSLRECVRLCPSATLFIPMKMIEQVGGFDEQLGVGEIYGAGEETDLLIRGRRAGYKVIYAEDLKVRHPVPIPEKAEDEERQTQRMEFYYRGIGALYKKHLFIGGYYELSFCFVEHWARLIVKGCLPGRYKRKKSVTEMKGFLYGLKNYQNNDKIKD